MAQPGSPLFLPGPGPLPVVGPLFENQLEQQLSYAVEVLMDAPAAYWRLDEPSGTTAVDVIGAANGTYVGSPALSAPGAVALDDAVTFSGASGQRVNVGNMFTPALQFGGDHTIEAWVNPVDRTNYWFVYTKCSSSTPSPSELRLEITTGIPRFLLASGSALASTAPPTGQWSHIVAVYHSGPQTVDFYLNGVPDSLGVAASSAAIGSTGTPMIAGRDDLFAGFNGGVDEVAVYPSALTADRILAHYVARTVPGSVVAAVAAVVSLDASGGTATASGSAPVLTFTYAPGSGTATTAGTVVFSDGLTAATGTATASGTTPTLTVVLTAASGTATAAGGTVSKIEVAANGLATASGGTDALTFAYTLASGAATASGGTDSFKVTLTAASGTASTAGTVVFKPTYLAASGAGTATGTLPVVTFIYGASTGTATASGGDATATGGSGVNLSASGGTASATGSASTLSFVYTGAGTASAGGTTPVLTLTYGVLSATATADGGLVFLGPPPASGRWDLHYGTHWDGQDGTRWPPGDGSGKWPGSTETRWPAVATPVRWN